MLFDDAGDATIEANKQPPRQTRWVVAGNSRWTIPQFGNSAQKFFVQKQQTPTFNWQMMSWRPELYQVFSVAGHKIESIIHPEMSAIVCLNQNQFCSWVTVFLNHPIPEGNIFCMGYSCDTFLCKWSNFLFFSMKSLPFLLHHWFFFPMDLVKCSTCRGFLNRSRQGMHSALGYMPVKVPLT